MNTNGKFAISILIAFFMCSFGNAERDDGFVSLFDGKSFKGWVIPEKAIPSWHVVDGVMINDGIGPDCGELIWTEREDYKDFIFKVDWRFSGEPRENMYIVYDYNGNRLMDEHENQVRIKGLNAGDSGVFFRGVRFDKNAPESSQNRFTRAQFNIWGHPMGSGQIHGYMVNREMPPEVRRGSIPLFNADKPIGEWNTFVFTFIDDHVTVELNGEIVIQKLYLPGLPEVGAIGLQQHVPGRNATRPYPVEFKNIFVKEL